MSKKKFILYSILIFFICSIWAQNAADSKNANKMQKQLKKYEKMLKKYEQNMEELRDEVKDLRERLDEVETDERVSDLRTEVEDLIDETQGEVIEERSLGLLSRFFGNRFFNISGYYNFEYLNDDKDDSAGRFRLHRFSIWFQKRVHLFNFFAEIEFEDAPELEGEGGNVIEEARGEIVVEQMWADFLFSPHLSVRAGLVLIPEYYNLNHFPTTTFATIDPLHRSKILPREYVGIAIYGDSETYFSEDFGFGYEVYVSNGEAPNVGKEDVNENKAVGGKVVFHAPRPDFVDILDIGANVYYGRDDEDNRDIDWNIEFIFETANHVVHAEYAQGRTDFVDPQQQLRKQFGAYILYAFRFWEKYSVFTRFEILDADRRNKERVRRWLGGARYKPWPEVSIKGEVFYEWHDDPLEEDFFGTAFSLTLLL